MENDKPDYSQSTASQLKALFPRTYKCWDNMKQRIKKGEGTLNKDFTDFKSFLQHVGACEDPDFTLDRIDNSDPEYAPNKVAWRNKQAQNSNKSDNQYLTYQNQTKTIAQWAMSTNQNPKTLYTRRNRGWIDEEIITGRKDDNDDSVSAFNPFPSTKNQWFISEYSRWILKHKYCSELEFLNQLAGGIYHPRGRDFQTDEGYLGILQRKLADNDQQIHQLQTYEPDDNSPDLKKLIEEKEKLMRNHNFWGKVFQETCQQIEYENRKQGYKESLQEQSRHEIRKIMDAYNNINPRPSYTINQL